MASLSSWRAWIEIRHVCADAIGTESRSPHGERGLKSHDINHGATKLVVALLMESVD